MNSPGPSAITSGPAVARVAQCVGAALAKVPVGSIADGARILVGLSGGIDSVALLLAFHALRESNDGLALHKCNDGLALHKCSDGLPLRGLPVEAVHVNHALQVQAADWQHGCEALCAKLGIVLHVRIVDARPASGEGPEAAARKARYAAFATIMRPGDIVACAHQRDDQAETVLLALLRGSGPRGLAGMASWRAFSPGWLFRPLLDVNRAELHGVVVEAGVTAVVDPSNADPRFKRSVVRHSVLPTLEACSPGAAVMLARVARHQAEAASMLDALGRADCGYSEPASDVPANLSAATLLALGEVRARNALRVWLADLGLPVPAARVFDTMFSQVVGARPDASPLVRWPGGELRRHRDRVWAGRLSGVHDPYVRLDWPGVEGGAKLELGAGFVWMDTIEATQAVDCVATAVLDKKRVRCSHVQVGFRRGGERCRPCGYAHRRPLKDLLREHDVPPWLRDRVPLLYLNGDLAAVGELWVCHGYEAGSGQGGLAMRWSAPSTCLDAGGS